MNYNHFHETPYFHHIWLAMFDNIKKGIEKIEMTKQNSHDSNVENVTRRHKMF